MTYLFVRSVRFYRGLSGLVATDSSTKLTRRLLQPMFRELVVARPACPKKGRPHVKTFFDVSYFSRLPDRQLRFKPAKERPQNEQSLAVSWRAGWSAALGDLT